MGNLTSCNIVPMMKNSKAARVVLPNGEIRQFREPTKAADLMLENPAYFLVNSCSLNIGRRFSALSADEDLEFGNVYIMFPMKRVNSVVTAADMTLLLLAANSAAKRISGGGIVKVSPELSPATTESTTEVNDGGRVSGEVQGLQELNKYRLSCKSKKPSLETIVEEPVCSR